jgi:hypothetical protein
MGIRGSLRCSFVDHVFWIEARVWWQALHHTISRTCAAAALPSVIGNPGGVFMSSAF